MSEQVLWHGIVVDVNELEQLRKDAERWRKLLAETLRNKGRIKVGMGGMWL